MVSLEQIRLLDKKVHDAVSRIDGLKRENNSLKTKLESYQHRISELEKLIENFKKDQVEIEDGIKSALEELNKLEDGIDTGNDEAVEDGPLENTPSQERSRTPRAPEEEGSTPSPASEQTDDTTSDELDIF